MRSQIRNPVQVQEQSDGSAVVIDVVRATSTITILLERAREVLVVGEPHGLDDLPTVGSAPYVVFSELDFPSKHERADNSPAQARRYSLESKRPVVVSTNGTRAIAAAMAHFARVYLGTFANLSALTAHLVRTESSEVTIIPAGNFSRGESRTEDDLCANALSETLEGREPDFVALRSTCLADSLLSRRLRSEPGLAEDVAICLSPNLLNAVVPEVHRVPDRPLVFRVTNVIERPKESSER